MNLSTFKLSCLVIFHGTFQIIYCMITNYGNEYVWQLQHYYYNKSFQGLKSWANYN